MLKELTIESVLNSLSPLEDTARYASAQPFPHLVIDNALDRGIVEQLHNEFPGPDMPIWHQYKNALEGKLACNNTDVMPPTIRALFSFFNSKAFVTVVGRLTGIEDLQSDPLLHGGGMHCIPKGGKLDIHLDYSIHPHLALERRINLILYLNREWLEDWNGSLELWDRDVKCCVQKIAPLFNRIVIFETGDYSFHGHPDPLTCPDGVYRKSLAVYYLSPVRERAEKRFRAKFVARPTDRVDEEMEKLRKARSGLDSAPDVYRTP